MNLAWLLNQRDVTLAASGLQVRPSLPPNMGHRADTSFEFQRSCVASQFLKHVLQILLGS